MPPASVLTALNPGDKVPLTTPDQATPDASGNVNLIALPASSTTTSGATTASTCVTILYAHLGHLWGNVGQAYVTQAGIDTNFTYGAGQSSTLGIGMSTTSPTAGFSADGSRTVSTTSTQGFPNFNTRTFNEYQTLFVTNEYEFICPPFNPEYFIQDDAWWGGAGVAHPSGAPGARYCMPEPLGSYWNQNFSTATTISSGWRIYGFNGTAQTGYTTSASTNWHFFGTSGQLCGTQNSPAIAPGVDVGS